MRSQACSWRGEPWRFGWDDRGRRAERRRRVVWRDVNDLLGGAGGPTGGVGVPAGEPAGMPTVTGSLAGDSFSASSTARTWSL